MASPTDDTPETVYHVATETQFDEIDPDIAHAIEGDGEYAVVWGAERVNETTVRIEKLFCEGGANDSIETFKEGINPADTVDQHFGYIFEGLDKTEEIEAARDYWRVD